MRNRSLPSLLDMDPLGRCPPPLRGRRALPALWTGVQAAKQKARGASKTWQSSLPHGPESFGNMRALQLALPHMPLRFGRLKSEFSTSKIPTKVCCRKLAFDLKNERGSLSFRHASRLICREFPRLRLIPASDFFLFWESGAEIR